MLTEQLEIANLAKQAPSMVFTSLNKHLTLVLLREAFKRTRKDGATGIDGQTAKDFEQDLENNLKILLDEAKSGRYFAPSVRRVHIPKGDNSSELRALGIPTFRDKVLQRAILMILEPLYEQDFLDCSYGFRPQKSPLAASTAVDACLHKYNGGWILDIDIRKFFDTLDHDRLREFLQNRIRDGVLLRLIGKWLKAGVMEDGQQSYAESGSPQGGVISPLLSNVYLHYVLDLWFHIEVQPRLKGPATLIRFADDFVIVCKEKSDAERIMAVLPKRFAKYGLSIHPDKSRLVNFTRPDRPRDDKDSDNDPPSFNFLGFTFHWGRSQKGSILVRRKTSKSRLQRTITRIGEACRRMRHIPIKEQQAKLNSMLIGHYNYYAITGNLLSVRRVHRSAVKQWFKWLQRRAQRRKLTWDRFNAILDRFPLRVPKIVHSVYVR